MAILEFLFLRLSIDFWTLKFDNNFKQTFFFEFRELNWTDETYFLLTHQNQMIETEKMTKIDDNINTLNIKHR